MKFSMRFADKIVGTLVVLALAALVIVVLMLGTNQRWFARDYQYRTYFYSATGLSTNMPVQYKGFTIGHVRRFSLAEDDSVEVLFTIFEEHNHRVRFGSIVELQASPIGLGNTFLFHPGEGPELHSEGDTIPELNSPQGRSLVERGLVVKRDSGDSINDIINQVNTLLDTINLSIVGAGGEADPALARIIRDVEITTAAIRDTVLGLSDQLDPILGNIETVTGRISEPSGTVMSMLDSDGPLVTDLTGAINSIAGIIDNLERTSDFIPSQLPQIAIMLRSVQDVLTAVSNNPLLRGGIPQRTETGPGGTSSRNLEF
jgi:phospholipid/cholesterol/gamma-HCH transport system substrate-binding protein